MGGREGWREDAYGEKERERMGGRKGGMGGGEREVGRVRQGGIGRQGGIEGGRVIYVSHKYSDECVYIVGVHLYIEQLYIIML